MKKKVLSLVLAMTMALFSIPVIVNAEQSGKCGDNLTWTYSDNGTLTISGTGDMNNTVYDAGTYTSYEWIDNFYDVKNLVLSDGVTSIGAYAFEALEDLKNITVPNGVTRIGMGAFQYSGVTSVTLPASLIWIDMGAFFECNLTDIYYEGTAEQWKCIDIASDYNDNLINGNIHFSETSSAENTGETVVTTDQGISITFGDNPTAQTTAEDKITVKLNGNAIDFDVQPQLINDRTMVPLRAIFEALGAEVEWNGEKQTILAVKGEVRILLQIGELSIAKQVNGGDIQFIEIDSAPVIISDRTLVPVRAIAESFDCSVDWDGATKTVNIYGSSAAGTSGNQTSNTVDMESDDSLEGTYNYYANAYIDNGSIYYAFIMKPYIYVYDGTSTKEYAAGGAPLGIIAYGNNIYYVNNDNETVCCMDKTSGERRIIFSKLSAVNATTIYRGNMYIKGVDGDNHTSLYKLNLADETSKLLYTADDTRGGVLSSATKIAFCGDKLCLFNLRDTDTNMIKAHMVCTVTLLDSNTGTASEVYSIEGDSSNAGYENSVTYYTDCPSNIAFYPLDGYVYFAVTMSNTEDGETTENNLCYKVNAQTAALSEISESEFTAAQKSYTDTSATESEWEYGHNSSSVYRKNKFSGVKETLVSGSGYRYLASDDNTVVVWQGERKGSNYSWASTENYKNAAIYTMDTDGNHLTEIMSYNAESGSASSVGSASGSSDQTCSTCGGSGMVTCHVCGGTGKGLPIYMLGQKVEQGCVTCGSTGKVVCGECGGSGKK